MVLSSYWSAFVRYNQQSILEFLELLLILQEYWSKNAALRDTMTAVHIMVLLFISFN